MSKRKQTVLSIIEPFEGKKGGLMPALHALQHHFGFIDTGMIPIMADRFNQTRADIFGVVSFYADFRDKKPAKHIVKICQAEACQAVGARELNRHAEAQKLGDVTFEPVYCLGNCACGPAVMVDEKVYGRVDNDRFDAIITAHKKTAKP
ncbi:MAG: NAD(P)H-dependent oxidoreductase subunit E [Sphingomonadales bacterium]